MALSVYKPEFDLFIFCLPSSSCLCSRHTELPKMKVLIRVSLTAPPATVISKLPKMKKAIWISQGSLPDSECLMEEWLRVMRISINIGSNLSRELWFDFSI